MADAASYCSHFQVTDYIFNVHRLSIDATLASLTSTPAGGGLIPAFSPTVYVYTLTVPNVVSSLTFTTLYSYLLASAVISRNNAPSVAMLHNNATAAQALVIPDTGFLIRATAEDSVTSKQYQITVHRQSIVVTLSTLSLSVPLLPAFSSTLYTYSIIVGTSALGVTAMATPASPYATMTYSMNAAAPIALASGSSTPNLPLLIGDNTLVIRVTSEDPVYLTQSYTIALHRLSADASAAAVAFTPSGTGLVLAFAPASTSYTMTVPNTVASVQCSTTFSYSLSTGRYQMNLGSFVTIVSGAVSTGFPLNVGDNQFAAQLCQ